MSSRSRSTERIIPGPGRAFAQLLGISVACEDDAEVPLGWHWLHMLDRPAQADLGPDGHPIRNTLLPPPEPGMRRMWAGGSIHVLEPLRFGEEATRSSEVQSITE